MSKVDVLIRRLDPGLPLPAYAHAGDAGADLVAAVDVELPPGERAVVPTGIAVALPDGYAAFIHPRSGLGAKLGVTIVNAPGTVDAGYRGEIKVTLLNTDPRATVRLRRGDRIAQMVVQRVERAVFHEVADLPGTARGANGFGSTGGFAAAGGPADGGRDGRGPAGRGPDAERASGNNEHSREGA
ncbi:deoxyuridine 5'-triphosphate nucleotidohydrolase DutT [Mycobacterium tuberculosis]|nr:deoxyuridine 5'-triphosphate nucleotidohydrolase DutT [Mycobacterium tuberculosis]